MLYVLLWDKWTPSSKLDFKEIVFGPFHTFGEPIVYISTMPRKRNSKRALWRRNSTSGSNFDKCHRSGTFLCMILQNFKKIAQRAAELYKPTIHLFLYLPTNLHCQRHNDTVPSCRPSIALLPWRYSVAHRLLVSVAACGPRSREPVAQLGVTAANNCDSCHVAVLDRLFTHCGGA